MEDEVICDRPLEDFSQSQPGEFPVGWTTRYDDDLAEARDKGLYLVERDQTGSNVLHAVYGDHTITIALPVDDWDLHEYPIMQWRWRAVRLPTGGDESDLGTNDSTASVYVLWEAPFPFSVSGIRYAWSSTLPVGSHVSRRFDHDQIVVLETGPSSPGGEWTTERVNVLSAYESFLSEEVEEPVLLALTTDADATDSEAEAYYAEFTLCRMEPPAE